MQTVCITTQPIMQFTSLFTTTNITALVQAKIPTLGKSY